MEFLEILGEVVEGFISIAKEIINSIPSFWDNNRKKK